VKLWQANDFVDRIPQFTEDVAVICDFQPTEAGDHRSQIVGIKGQDRRPDMFAENPVCVPRARAIRVQRSATGVVPVNIDFVQIPAGAADKAACATRIGFNEVNRAAVEIRFSALPVLARKGVLASIRKFHSGRPPCKFAPPRPTVSAVKRGCGAVA
jgi:hypothetical protein